MPHNKDHSNKRRPYLIVAILTVAAAVTLYFSKGDVYDVISNEITPGDKLFTNNIMKPKKPVRHCIDGISYIYIHEVFTGGMSPEYINGLPVTCNGPEPAKRNEFPYRLSISRFCWNDQIYYYVHGYKGAAISAAINASGKGVQCNEKNVDKPS